MSAPCAVRVQPSILVGGYPADYLIANRNGINTLQCVSNCVTCALPIQYQSAANLRWLLLESVQIQAQPNRATSNSHPYCRVSYPSEALVPYHQELSRCFELSSLLWIRVRVP